MAKPTPKPTDAAGIRLQHPDRSRPQGKTLLDFAGEQSLFAQAAARQRELDRQRGVKTRVTDDADDADDADAADAALSPRAERILDTALWCVSLAILHFTLDVLVQNQYAVAIEWPEIATRAGRALAVFALLFYALHRHASDPRLLRGLPDHLHDRLRQLLFFAAGALAGCYLVHITNWYSYLAVMEQAPPIGCLWVWSIIELDLPWAVASLAVVGAFMKTMGYGL